MPKLVQSYEFIVHRTKTLHPIPYTLSPRQGFTLIELLVVIAIIAVLAIMGFAAFRGFTGRANDDRRLADLKAISGALEANTGIIPGTSGYVPLAASQFASGIIPQ